MMSKKVRKNSEQRYERSLESAWRALAVRAERVENARSNVWALRPVARYETQEHNGKELPCRVMCAKTGAFIRTVPKREIAHLVELHGKESALQFLQAECVSVSVAWKFEKPGTIKKLAQHDPVGFFVYAISKLTGLHAINSRDNIETRYQKTLAKHALYQGLKYQGAANPRDTLGPFDTLTEINEYLRRILALTSAENAQKYIGAAQLRELVEHINPTNLRDTIYYVANALLTLIRAFLLKNRANRRTLATYGLTATTMQRIALEFDGDRRFAEMFFDTANGEKSEAYDMFEFMMLEGFDMEFSAIAEENSKTIRAKRQRAAELRKRVAKAEAGKPRVAKPGMFDSFDFVGESFDSDDSDDSDNNGMFDDFENLDGFSIVNGEDLDSDRENENESEDFDIASEASNASQRPKPTPKPARRKLTSANLDFSSTIRKDSIDIFAKLRKG